MEPNTLNDPLPPNPPGVTDTHLESHMQTAMHSSFPPPSCRYSPPLLPESNPRHQPPSHTPVLVNPRRQGSPHASAVLNHIPSSTTTPPSLAPCIPSTVAMNNLNPPQGYKGFFKVSSFKNSKRASMSSKLLKPFRVKGLQDLIL